MKIIVLTPVKNEEWILNQFLTITSLFADCIIIADQKSTDKSRQICLKFPKVYLIENTNNEFNEADRQVLLIETARKLFPAEKRILFGLDSDELFSADSTMFQNTWSLIKSLSPGTTIYLEKPDILFGIQTCARSQNNYAPLGYVDDNIPHHPSVIHSKRIPDNPDGENIYINDIKILHFAHSRRKAQSAKLRFYSVLENIKQTNPIYLRRYFYKCFYNEATNYPIGSIEVIPTQWLGKWDTMDINLRNLCDPDFAWHDFEVLKKFKEYGYKKFYWDDIWGFDWEGCRQLALKCGKEAPLQPIVGPGKLTKILSSFIDMIYNFSRKVRNS